MVERQFLRALDDLYTLDSAPPHLYNGYDIMQVVIRLNNLIHRMPPSSIAGNTPFFVNAAQNTYRISARAQAWIARHQNKENVRGNGRRKRKLKK